MDQPLFLYMNGLQGCYKYRGTTHMCAQCLSQISQRALERDTITGLSFFERISYQERLAHCMSTPIFKNWVKILESLLAIP